MDLNLLLIALPVLLFISIFSVLNLLFAESGAVQKRVWYAKAPGKTGRLASRLEQWLKPLGRLARRSPREVSKERLRLIRAGFRGPDVVYLFIGVRVAVALSALLVLALLGMPQNNFLLFVLLPVLLAALLPDLWLNWRVSHRQKRIQLGLADMADLLVIMVEAGMGLDQAILRICREIHHSHPELSDELRVYHFEVQAGQKRVEALRNLAERTGVTDLKSLTVALIQSDRFGTSIAQTLRVYSDTLRTTRRQRAEEQAAKMGVKILFPLLVFIFPSIFVVVAGPAVIAIIRKLLPTLAGN